MTAVQAFGTVDISVVSSNELGSGDIAFLAASSNNTHAADTVGLVLVSRTRGRAEAAPRRGVPAAGTWRAAHPARAACGRRRLAANQRQPAL